MNESEKNFKIKTFFLKKVFYNEQKWRLLERESEKKFNFFFLI